MIKTLSVIGGLFVIIVIWARIKFRFGARSPMSVFADNINLLMAKNAGGYMSIRSPGDPKKGLLLTRYESNVHRGVECSVVESTVNSIVAERCQKIAKEVGASQRDGASASPKFDCGDDAAMLETLARRLMFDALDFEESDDILILIRGRS